MDTQNILSALCGAEIKHLKILSDHAAADQREVCVQLTLTLPLDPSAKQESDELLICNYAQRWLKMKYKTVKRSTYDRHEATVTHQIIPYFGQIRLNDLQADCVQDWIDELSENYTFSTVSKGYQCLNAIVEHACLHHFIADNPIKGRVVLPRSEGYGTREIMVFTNEECERIISASYAPNEFGVREPLAPLFPFLLHTGLRIGEALALRWADVDFTHKYVKIRKNIKSVKNRSGNPDEPHYITIEQFPKTKTSDRIVPLNRDALKALSFLRNNQDSTALIFSNQEGTHCTYPAIRRMLERIFRRANVKVRGFHTFRHTFATHLFAQGVEVKTVSSILGHSSVKITIPVPNSNTKTHTVPTDN